MERMCAATGQRSVVGRRVAALWVVAAMVVLCAGGTTLADDGPTKAKEKQAPPADAEPFPLGRTTTVKGLGTKYYIDGPSVIPKNAEITVQRGVTIIGINGATLDIQGGLKIHGTQDTWVTIHAVDFSPTSMPRKDAHFDMVDFRGCRFQHADDQSIGGGITIENSCFQRDCTFDVRITGGFLKIMTVEFGMPCRVRSIRDKENRKPIEFEVRSSWMKAIHFSGPAMANFRHSEIRGGLHCMNVTQVVVDGCDISETLSFQQAAEESFKKLTLTKCNMFGEATVVCARPAGPKVKKERVRLQKFYFGPKDGPGLRDKDDIQARLRDGSDAEDGNVTIQAAKPNKRSHKLVNYDTLRDRAPALR